MKRRGWTVCLGIVLVGLLTWAVLGVKVPYVMVGPGPTVDTLGSTDGRAVIDITGRSISTSTGQLRLVTVGVHPDLTLADAIYYWFDPDNAVVPRELFYGPQKSQKQVDEENAAAFQQSQTSAETVALKELGYPSVVSVKEVIAAPAAGVLQAGDVITAVDGTAVDTPEKLTAAIKAKPAGTARTIAYTRGGETRSATLTTSAGQDGTARIGVSVEEKQPHPFQIKIEVNDIGGPSAGLMFALGIIDLLTPEDLTGGAIIAGTGELAESGAVGPIGGIPQKLLAAKDAGATVFLTPDRNCAEAAANGQPGLKLARVATIDDALNALTAIREHRDPPLCSLR